MNRVRIVADEREKPSGVPDVLNELGFRIEFAQLPVADYILSHRTAIERKSLRDFVSSIYDGRIFKQCAELSSKFPRPILLVEGNIAEEERIRENPANFYGSLASLITMYGIFTIFTDTYLNSALAIKSLMEHLADERGKGPLITKAVKTNDPSLEQVYFVSALPGIGVKLARRLLETFKTPSAIINASIPELAKVPGVGRAKAVKIRKVLDAKFAEAKETSQAKLIESDNLD
ncbi:MAG: heavy metal resistance protein CzcA [Thaumarchaeota archaeon]|nr:heavy metal resistance protein CzcA [Nitrososphaerota archaeon]